MKRLFAALFILLFALAPIRAIAGAPTTYPTIFISEVDRNNSVTINAYNFPSGEILRVRMNYFGTLGISGTVVTTMGSGSGNFTATYAIPAAFHGLDRIAIRLEGTESGYYAYNWFWNFDHPDAPPGPTATPDPAATPTGSLPPGGAGSIPVFSITAVDRNSTVTIKATNFTTNDTYTVLMNYYGTLGINGVVVGSQNTDGTGKFTATYFIPAQFVGEDKIAIRLESDTTAYYSYNWFWNFDHP